MRDIIISGRRWITDQLLQPFFRWVAVYLGRKAKMTVTPRNNETPSEWKQQALSDFNAWLTDLPEELPEPGPAEMTSCDLYTLLTEFTALRQEIKFQNRQQHHTLEAQQDLSRNQKDMADLFQKGTEGLDRLEENIRKSSEKRTAAYFLDVRDALNRGLAASRKAAVGSGLFKRPPKGMDSIVEGYEMALRRFDRALSHLDIRPVETVGRPFDPTVMQAIDRRFMEGAPPGVVLEELEGGFVRDTEVVRTARVIVNGS